MNELQSKLDGIGYIPLIDDFNKLEGRFPDSLYEVYLSYKHDYPEEIGYIEIIHFIDIFSKKGRWVGYFPIYNSDDSQIISYLILSAGIDGKLDNVNDPPVRTRFYLVWAMPAGFAWEIENERSVKG